MRDLCAFEKGVTNDDERGVDMGGRREEREESEISQSARAREV